MNIIMLEPLAVAQGKIDELGKQLTAKGHSFKAFDSIERDSTKLIERAKDADVLIIANSPLPGEVISACQKLKYISVAFVGIDHIGVNVCRERGINISNAAGYCDDAVAELALGLTLDCLRNITVCDSACRHGATKAGLIGHELRGRTVGIVGTGAIGCSAAKLFAAFGCKLLGYSRSERRQAKDIGIEYVPLDELLKRSDIVSLHTPLTAETCGLISAERLALMQPHAILINTSRGPVVDNEALAFALNTGSIAAAGIDVFDVEPPLDAATPLLHAKNAVCTPHIAFATLESLERRAFITFDNVHKWLEGEIQNKML